MWRCPGCGNHHDTLKAVLMCHPEITREYTDEMERGNYGTTLYQLFCGTIEPRLRRKVAMILGVN